MPLPSGAIDSKAIQLFLGEYRKAREQNQATRAAHLQRLILEYDNAFDKKYESSSPQVNMHTLYRLGSDELRQSSFLAWMLNSRASHGQGSLFLKTLVRVCRLKIQADDLRQYVIRRELSGMNSIIDIAIYKKAHYIIFIENKLNAAEGDEQVDREYADLKLAARTLGVPQGKAYAVFLTLDGRKPMSGDATQWIQLSYNRLAQGIKKQMDSHIPSRLRFIIEDWADYFIQLGDQNEALGRG
jgi:hypothetical protein